MGDRSEALPVPPHASALPQLAPALALRAPGPRPPHLASITLCAELVLDIVVAERRLLDAGDGHRRLLLGPRAVPACGGSRAGGHAQRARGGLPASPACKPRRGPQPPWPPQTLTFLQLNALLGLGSLVVAAGAHEGQGPGSARPAPLAGAQRPAARPSRPGPRQGRHNRGAPAARIPSPRPPF